MNRWWCRLNDHRADPPAARALGIQAWVLDTAVDGNGSPQAAALLASLLQAARGDGPAVSLLLHVRSAISPRGEEQLATALAPWLVEPGWLRYGNRPVLLLGVLNGLSHPRFGLQRLRLSLRRQLRRLGCAAEPWLVGSAQAEGCDAVLLWPSNGVQEYRMHLQRAHHGPWPAEGLIPVVRPPQPAEAGGTADLYREWLAQAGALSRCCWDGNPDAPVLLDGAAAHQQWWVAAPAATTTPPPDRAQPLHGEPPALAWGSPKPNHLALLVHGFYPDRLVALLARLGGEALDRVDLYVSTTVAQRQEVADLLQAQGWPRVRLFAVENRGRDLAPFLRQLLPSAIANGHELFVKVHTKRSDHLADGEAWAEHLLGSLLEPTALEHNLALFQANPRLGLLAPAGTLMACSVALEANVEHLLTLCTSRGVRPSSLLQRRFIAGSMMVGRLEALQAMLELSLPLEGFEQEQGQTDGTLAHALERWLCCEAAAHGWELRELPGDAWAVPAFGHGRPPEHRAGSGFNLAEHPDP